jgi:hypothetical protein
VVLAVLMVLLEQLLPAQQEPLLQELTDLLPPELQVVLQLDTWLPQQVGLFNIIVPMGRIQPLLVLVEILVPVFTVNQQDIPVVQEQQELQGQMVLQDLPLQLGWQERYLLL